MQAEHRDARDATLLARLREAARAASALIRDASRELGALEWRAKSAADFVSDVDTGAERVVRDALGAHYPEARFLGEELSPTVAADLLEAPLTFIVDPLDGTTNFLHGYPQYAVSIAALADGVLEAGIVLHVPSGDEFTARRGAGAFCGDARLAVSRIDEPARALIGTGFPFKNPELLPAYLPQFDAVTRATAGVRRAGSAALDLADVACGRFDAFWELVLAPWDFAAGMLLVREAGGLVTTLDGGDVPWRVSPILAGNVAMHDWLARTIRGATPPSPSTHTPSPLIP